MQAKAGLPSRRAQRPLRLAQLARINEHVNVIGGEMRQALIIPQDEPIDPGLLPGMEYGGD